MCLLYEVQVGSIFNVHYKKTQVYTFLFKNEGPSIKFVFGIDMDIIAIFDSCFTLLYRETNLNLISFNNDK